MHARRGSTVGSKCVLNSVTGEVIGGKGSFLISEELLPQIQFIHSGTFVESGGQPTLKLLGDVVPINSQLVQPTKVFVTARPRYPQGIPAPGVASVAAGLRQTDLLRAFGVLPDLLLHQPNER